MNEKKLTDEEIVKALENCLNGNYKTKCKDCYYDKLDNICKDMDRDLLDLIHRLQAENERLTEEKWDAQDDLDNYHEINRELGKQNAELQKQVDELKERYLEESKERVKFEQFYQRKCHDRNIGLGVQRAHYEKKLKQAVKDTAKEIYRKAEKKSYFKDGGHYDKDRYLLDMANLKEIVNGYGVEVE